MASIIFFLCIAFLAPAFAHGTSKLADCGGPDKIVAFKNGSVQPDPVMYPGNISLSLVVDVLKDLPASGFELNVDLLKKDPEGSLPLPCLLNFGSCTYDFCEMIKEHGSKICPYFPDPDECGCPIKAGSYNIKDAQTALPDIGEALGELLRGQYEGKITLIDADTNRQLGCCEIAFEVVTSS